MNTVHTQGLLLQALPYLKSHRIIKILTPQGMISLIARFAATKKGPWQALTTPFLFAEWTYALSPRSSLPSMAEAVLIDDFAPLKTDFERLSSAGTIGRDLLRTQPPGKLSEIPLSLAVACFKKMPLFPNPAVLVAAFRLRLLLHEGVLAPEELPTPLLPLALLRSFSDLATCSITAKESELVSQLFQTHFD